MAAEESRIADETAAEGLSASAMRMLAGIARYAGRRLYSAAILVAAGALLDGVSLLLLVPLLSVVMGGSGPSRLQEAAGLIFRLAGMQTQFGRLSLLLGIFSLLMILRALVQRARDTALFELQNGFVEARRMAIIEALAAAPWGDVARLKHARITHIMSGDIQRIAQGTFMLTQTIVSVTMLLVQAGLALALSPALALIAFALLAVMGGALLPLIYRARNLGSYVTHANLTLLNTTTQFLGGLKLAVSQNLQSAFVDEFRQTLGELSARQTGNLRMIAGGRAALTTLTALAGAALVLVGFGAMHLSAPLLIALLAVIARMSGPVGQIQQGAQQLAFALPAYDEVLRLEAQLRRAAAPAPLVADAPWPGGDIVFEDVCYTHVEEDGAMRGVSGLSLSIRQGEFLGIAGPSGAGKTTFADLLAGLYRPQQGHVRIGGVELAGAIRDGLRAHLSYVSQDPFLFHDSIRRNLAWAAPGADEAAMWRALELAGAGDLVRRNGLDAIVGERGALMSGGERQRIALARAVLRQPRLLILDEATSAIDIASEREILRQLKALQPQTTMIIIAHRPESLAHCDRVVEFAAGGLVRESSWS